MSGPYAGAETDLAWHGPVPVVYKPSITTTEESKGEPSPVSKTHASTASTDAVLRED